MIFLKLFFTFFKIGLFGFGGGYGMLSLIQSETVTHNAWMTSAEFANIVAISQMTPGPIGINAATYCGYTAVHNAAMGETMAVLGSATATLALVLPSFILMILICRLFMKYMNSMVVQSIMSGLRPAVVGLIAAAALLLMNSTVNKPLVFRHQHLYFRSHTHWYNGVKNKPYTNDMLGGVCRTDAALLIEN